MKISQSFVFYFKIYIFYFCFLILPHKLYVTSVKVYFYLNFCHFFLYIDQQQTSHMSRTWCRFLSHRHIDIIRFNLSKHPAKEANSNLADHGIIRKSRRKQPLFHREAASVISPSTLLLLATPFRVHNARPYTS